MVVYVMVTFKKFKLNFVKNTHTLKTRNRCSLESVESSLPTKVLRSFIFTTGKTCSRAVEDAGWCECSKLQVVIHTNLRSACSMRGIRRTRPGGHPY